ncbi:MAG: hypothetical protein ABEL76_03205 [Bradymonadaceae bacterium]
MVDIPDGKCRICGDEFSNTGMTRHLKSCLGKRDARSDEPPDGLLIRASGEWAPHWLHALATLDGTLTHLDNFLRSTWVECCGHLSEFQIGGARYASGGGGGGFGPSGKSMNVPMGEVLGDGTEFEYIYDFGSSTRLSLKCYGRVTWPDAVDTADIPDSTSGPVWCVARNLPPELPCEVCGDQADEVCTACFHRGEGLVCSDHRDDHDCGHPMFLPAVNSPRMGVCGYTG